MHAPNFAFLDQIAAKTYLGCEVVGKRGEPVGTVAGFWLDPSTHQAAYIGIKSSSFPHNCHVVPAADGHIENGIIRINLPADQIKQAPIARPGLELAQIEKEEIDAHFKRFMPLRRITSVEEIRPEEAIRPQDAANGQSKKYVDEAEDRSEITKDEQSFFKQTGFVTDSMPEVDVSKKDPKRQI
jgi:PRC-barrel domain protein